MTIYANINRIIVGVLCILVLVVAFPRATYSALHINAPRIRECRCVDLPTDAGVRNIRVTWRRVKKVSGYQVMVSKKKEETDEWITYEGYTRERFYNIETADSTQTKIRVRAYKNFGGKYFYGEWSKEKICM